MGTVNFTYHNMYKFTFCLLFLALAISTSNGKTLEIKQHPSIKMVSCGNHLAPSCAECGNNRRVCTGSCKWEGCLPRSKDFKASKLRFTSQDFIVHNFRK